MRHRWCINRLEIKPGENGNLEVNGWQDSWYMRENRTLHEIVNRYWSWKLPWIGITRRTLQETCWGNSCEWETGRSSPARNRGKYTCIQGRKRVFDDTGKEGEKAYIAWVDSFMRELYKRTRKWYKYFIKKDLGSHVGMTVLWLCSFIII